MTHAWKSNALPLRFWVNLIKKVGTGGILAALDSVVPPSRADITVATAHKSKGREWNHVHLADDLAEFYVDAVARDSEWHIQDALMLIYVAITRVRDELTLYVPAAAERASPFVEAMQVGRAVARGRLQVDAQS